MNECAQSSGKDEGGRRVTLPPGCRLALAMDCTGSEAAQILRDHPSLRRLYLVGGEASTPARDSRIRQISREGPVAERLAPFFAEDFLCFAEGRVALGLTAANQAAQPELCRELGQALLDHARKVASTVALHATRGWHMLANTLLNLPAALAGSSLSNLQGKGQGRALVIVGAGPSLDANIQELAVSRDKVVVIACDAACATLIRAGIPPDLVVTTDDSERIWRYFAPLKAAGCTAPVVSLLQGSWPVARYSPGPLCMGVERNMAGELLHHLAGFPFFDSGQCVGHAALEIALLLGGSPIIMIGFDLGYREGRFHPRDMQLPYFHLHPPPKENLTTVMGQNGQPIITDLSMAMYLREFERRIARAPVPVWNATEGGARLAGTRTIPLKNALAEIPAPATPWVWTPIPITPPTSADALKIRWLKAAENLIGDLNSAPTPLAQGPLPFPFLDTHRELLALMSPADNAAEIAAFHNAWEDWKQNPSGKPELGNLAKIHLGELASSARLVQLLLALGGKRPLTIPRTVLCVSRDLPPPPGWTALRNSLEEAGLRLVDYTGNPNDLLGVWDILLATQASAVLMNESALMPAAWGMPGLVCLDFHAQPPGPNTLPEQNLPGYAVVCAEAGLAAGWRRHLPPDRPVYLLVENGLIPAGEPSHPPKNVPTRLKELIGEIQPNPPPGPSTLP